MSEEHGHGHHEHHGHEHHKHDEDHGHHKHHSHGKDETVTFKKETLWKAGTFIFAALFVITLLMNGGIDFDSIGRGSGNGGGNAPAPTVPPTTGNIKITLDDSDPILGDNGADITIVEFSDFQCPFCQRAADGAVAEFKQSDYFKKGDVKLTFKHFPLSSIHPQAQKAAEASECANRQDKFWEMHDIIFANQRTLDVVSLKSYAGQIGLDTGKFNKCLDGNEAADKVASDLKQATDAGGRGTPYFVLINKDGDTAAVSGAQPWVNFEAAIKSLQ
jgi:protein-disulfide isomerase